MAIRSSALGLWRQLWQQPRGAFLSVAPILRRELLTLLRTKKAFRITLAVVCGSSLFTLGAWPEGEEVLAFLGSSMAFNSYKQTLSWLAILCVPAVAGAAISVERERETWELLYNTYVRPAGLVFGKLLAHTGYFFLLLAFTAPIACVLFLAGGISTGELVESGLELAVLILSLGILGLWCSIRERSTAKAVMTAYALMFLFWVIKWVVFGVFTFGFWQRSFVLSSFLLESAPLVAISVVLFILLLRRARYPDLAPKPLFRQRQKIAPRTRAARAPVTLSWFTRAILSRVRDGIPDRWNPVFAASLRSEVFGHRRQRRLLLWGVLAILGLVALAVFLLYAANARSYDVWDLAVLPPILLYVTYFVGIYYSAVIFPGAAASIVASEVDENRLDLLRGTLLRPGRILFGKLLALFCAPAGLLIFATLASAFVSAESLIAPRIRDFPLMRDAAASWVCLSLFVTTLFTVVAAVGSSGFLAACLTRRGLSASLLAYVIAGGILVGLPLLVGGAFSTSQMHATSPLFSFPWALLTWTRDFGLYDDLGWTVLDVYGLSHGLSFAISAGLYVAAFFVFRRRWLRDS